jgi:hypothetical protein
LSLTKTTIKVSQETFNWISTEEIQAKENKKESLAIWIFVCCFSMKKKKRSFGGGEKPKFPAFDPCVSGVEAEEGSRVGGRTLNRVFFLKSGPG